MAPTIERRGLRHRPGPGRATVAAATLLTAASLAALLLRRGDRRGAFPWQLNGPRGFLPLMGGPARLVAAEAFPLTRAMQVG